jgi:tRNA A-37 threonylcarbamoyl transferase component Bud32
MSMTGIPSSWEAAQSAGGVRWWAVPGLCQQLLGPAGLHLGAAVKSGPHRIVRRVELAEGLAIYIKHNLLPDARAWLRQCVRPSKARMEMELALALAQRGIPTIEPLALGEQEAAFGAGASYLVTRALEGTQTLNTLMAVAATTMSQQEQTRLRQRLAIALGRFVARLHEAGVKHGDFHAANILVRLDDNGHPHFWLIDLNTLKLGAPLDWGAARENLVMLARWFMTRVSRPDRLRFWQAYYEARRMGPWPRGRCRSREHQALAGDLEWQTLASALVFWKNRDRRSLGHNRYYRRVAAPGVAGHAVTDLDTWVIATIVANPDAPFCQPGVRLLKDSPSSTVAELVIVHEGRLRRVIYKRFRVTAWSESVAALVRPTAALRSWRFGHGLRERCLPTARPLLVLHRVQAGMKRDGYLLCEKIEQAVDLHRFVDALSHRPAGAACDLLRRGIAAVARTVYQLHRCKLSHRDLKAANLLISTELQDPASPFQPVGPVPAGATLASRLPEPVSSVWFIDLVGVRLHTYLSRRRRARDLARLNASFHQSAALTRTDKLRFLRAYLRWHLQGRGGWKTWWRAIAAATQAKVARNARRGRVLA